MWNLDSMYLGGKCPKCNLKQQQQTNTASSNWGSQNLPCLFNQLPQLTFLSTNAVCVWGRFTGATSCTLGGSKWRVLLPQSRKTLAVCLGAVEEILLTSWNEGRVRKEVVFQWKDVCPIPTSASCWDVHSLDIRNSNTSLSECHAGF